MLCCDGSPPVRQTRRWPALRLLAAVALLLAPVLGSTAGIAAPSAAATPAPRAALAPFTDGRCASGDTTSVTVVIDFQELGGGTVVRCGRGLQAGANGIAAMRAAGIAFDGNARFGSAFVCRIMGHPSASEALPIDGGGYQEKCIDTSPAKAYWSYWQASENGDWVYSSLGIGSSKARLGGFEGWSFSLNKTSSTNPKPGVTTTLEAPVAPPTTATPPTLRPAPPTATPAPTRARPTTARTPTAPTTIARPTTGPAPQPRPTPDGPAATPVAPPVPAPAPAPAPTTVPTAPVATAPAPGSETGTPAPDPVTSPPAGGTTDNAAPPGDTGGPATSTEAAAIPGGVATSRTTARPSTSRGPARSSASRCSAGSAPSSQSTSRSRSTGPDTSATSRGPIDPAAPDQGTSTEPAAVDPDMAATEVVPEASSPWPVIAVLSLALIAGGGAFVIARRRRGDGA